MQDILTAAAPETTQAQAPFLERRFIACAALLLGIMAVALSGAAILDSDTLDESYHLRHGFEFLKTGQLPPILEHPPLAQVISALPLLPLGLRLQPAATSTTPRGPEWFADSDFLYANRVSPEAILIAGRSAKVLLTLAFGGVIAWWTRRHFGAAAALAALLLFAFDPNILAHGHLATTDMAAAFGFFAGCIAWNAFLARGDMRSAFLCGLVTGLALAVKYSALVLPVLYAVMYLLHGFQQVAAERPPRWRISLGHLCKSMAVVMAGMFVAVYISYGFETGPLLPPELGDVPFSKLLRGNHLTLPLAETLDRHAELGRPLDRMARRTPIPAPSFFRGMLYVTKHYTSGHTTYFLGQLSITGGWWYYFPVLFGIKSPTGLLLLLALGVAAAFRIALPAGQEAVFKVLRARHGWFAVTIPPLVFFLIATRSRINIGIRHILPVYPFVFIWVAAALFASRRPALPAFLRWAGVACLALVAVESAAAFPRYIPFFNWPSGGRSEGRKYVVDSNLDWGQDMKRLRDYLEKRHAAGNVCLATFSQAPPARLGITAHPIPESAEEARAQGCLVVVSLSVLYEWPPTDGGFDWMLRRQPTERVADSFNVYDVRTDR